MKKLDKRIHESFPPTTLYLDDLKDIERILRENCKDIQIVYADYKYDSVEEMVNAIGPKEVKTIDLEASKPYTDRGRTHVVIHDCPLRIVHSNACLHRKPLNLEQSPCSSESTYLSMGQPQRSSICIT